LVKVNSENLLFLVLFLCALEIDYETILIEAGRAPEDDVEMIGLMRAFGQLDQEDRRQVMEIVERYRKTST